MVEHKWPEPAWIAALPEDERDQAKVRYYLNIARAFYSPRASLPEFSLALGLAEAHLNVCRQRGRVSPEIAVKIETLLGRAYFPRELFNEIFVVAER